jgi:hypothetical protein
MLELLLFLDAVASYSYTTIWMHDELERIWKEAIVK